MENDIEEIVGIMEEFGYNPIHIIGRLYLVRYNSTRFSVIPFYVLRIIKNKKDGPIIGTFDKIKFKVKEHINYLKKYLTNEESCDNIWTVKNTIQN